MMDAENFKNIIQLYETLRLHKVLFPQRNTSSYFFINFDGPVSPMIEQMKGGQVYEEPSKQLALIKLKVERSHFREERGDKEVEGQKAALLFRLEKILQEISMIKEKDLLTKQKFVEGIHLVEVESKYKELMSYD